ncbi:Alpha/Beta hydrolase protein [Gautieria morchelliformis]|nr:Alpha/Beta hydrolase protein [Gautieria morchelliformis]
MSEGLKPLPLPSGITSRIVPHINGLDMHILEAGVSEPSPASDSHRVMLDPPLKGTATPLPAAERPLLLLLHGFPEIAYSFRKIMVPLAMKGYHIVAPDQRGYGRTTGWSTSNGESFRVLHLVADLVALVLALGRRSVACVVGHDFGSLVAGHCSLVRPDMFRSVVLMSAPFLGPPSFVPATGPCIPPADTLPVELAALDPPRKHYQLYFASPTSHANEHMLQAPQGLSAFLRAYYHMKSADWTPNRPHPLTSWSAPVIAQMPEYYIMHADKTMAETVAPHLPHTEPFWLTDAELGVYVAEFSRTTFQGGLNWYQFSISPELRVFSEKLINVPAQFIAGEFDWGPYQAPGSMVRMRQVCEHMGPDGCHFVKGAGHWVQQERPEEVVKLITQFLAEPLVTGMLEGTGRN